MKRIALLLIGILVVTPLMAQRQQVQHRPYADQRKWHYGFFTGLHTQDLKLTNSGYNNGEDEIFADVSSYAPGFTVGVIGELYMQKYLALRILPSVAFGEKTVTFRGQNTGTLSSQHVRSTYLMFPFMLKFSAERVNNHRPYLTVGLSPTLDFSTKKQQAILLNKMDCCLEIGLGCDFYERYFKLIPELKFSFGLTDVLAKKRTDTLDPEQAIYAQTVSKAHSRMISLVFYFE